MNVTHPSIEQIVDYLHGELPATQDAAMHAHLAGCRSCDERRAEELSLTERLRAYARAQERDLPTSVAAKIRAGVESRRTPLVARLAGGLRPVLLLPAAAALALILYAASTVWHGANAPTAIDAAYYVDEHAAMATIAPFPDGAAPPALTAYDETR